MTASDDIITPDEVKKLGELAAKTSGEFWRLTIRGDDGVLFVSTLGDIVCLRDFNHSQPDSFDLNNFTYIAYAHPRRIQSLLARLAEAEQWALTNDGEMRHHKARAEAVLAVLAEAGIEWTDNDPVVYKTCGKKWGRCRLCRCEIAPDDADERNRSIYVHASRCLIASLPTQTTAHLERVRALEANQRTPGTVEVCGLDNCHRLVHQPVSDGCTASDCPIRHQKEECRG